MAAGTGKSDLARRIKAEFEASAKKKQDAEQQRAKQTEEHDKRMAQFAKACEELQSIWRPRLEEFAAQFGEKIKMTPTVTPHAREAKVVFMTELANVTLTLTAAPSADGSQLALDYDLLLIPIYFEYERHSRLEQPINKIDANAVGKWIDDRLISCVKTYLAMRENEYYIKRALVEDPITKSKLLREDAVGKVEHGGKTFYFSSEDSMRKFKAQSQPAKADGSSKQSVVETKSASSKKPAPPPATKSK